VSSGWRLVGNWRV